MRNLKRVLALAMAMVMVLGMMVIGSSAASYSDAAAINEDYAEAVEVLTGMGVFKGTGAGFAPKAILSRAEAAALIYRVISADVKDSKIDLYNYSSFDDVAEGQWYTGYVTYAANGDYIKGDGNGNFLPDAKVTGIQVLAIMLRAMGYGQKGEFEGAGWKDGVLTVADDLDILDNVAQDDLDKPASRELVAQLLWDAIQADTTTYMPAFGYIPSTISLGEKKFELDEAADVDEWGRPLYGWTYNTGDEATMFVESHVTYYTAVTECDVASATKQKAPVKNYVAYTNGVLNSAPETITATATVATIGAQGQLTEVYPKSGVIVHIDTLLAQVTDVKNATYDAAGHLRTPSSISMNIYYTNTAVAEGGYIPVTLTNGKTNYEYAKGDVVLVSAVQTVAGVVRTDAYKHVEIQGLAEAMTGAQSTIWFQAEQHTVNGTIYNDNNRFHLDEAGYETVNHTWYFDAQGNLIGVVDIDTIYAYGVLSSLYWVNDGSNYGAGAAYGVITYMDGTNSGIVEIDAVDGLPTVYARDTVVGPVDTSATPDGVADVYYVSTYGLDNAALLLTELYEIETQADGTLLLTKQSKTTGADSDIIPGVSKVGDETLYADNNTQYLVYNTVTKSFSAVTGYENIAKFTNIDFCYKNGTAFLKYVFIKATPDEASASDFAFITNAGVNFSLKKFGGVDYITISGVVRADGSTTPIVVKGNAEGTTAATLAALQTKFTNAIGKLYKVPTLGGSVVDVDAIVEVTGTAVQQSATSPIYAEYEGKPTNYTNNGVLIADSKYYNVNAATTIVTKDGIGTTADLTAAVVNGKQVYVVYNTNLNTTAIAVFITDYAPAVVNPNAGKDAKVVSAANGSVFYFDTLAEAITNARAGDVVTMLDDATLTAQLDLPYAITLDGNNFTITAGDYKTATSATNGGILVSAAGTTIKNLTVVGPNTNIGWDNGEYGIKVYAAATLENVTVTGANAGIQVAANTTLKGTINVSGNEFGGIEVKSSAVMTIATGAVIVNATETAAVPTAWMDAEFDGTITGGTLTSKIMSDSKVYYYVNSANATV